MAESLLRVENLEVRFETRRRLRRSKRRVVHAVSDVGLDLAAGETLGLVGESGCGKSTLARAIVRLLEPDAGRISFDGAEIARAGRRELAPLRRELQMVFQDPSGALNPRKTAGQSIALPLRLDGTAKDEIGERVGELLKLVGLAPEHARRYPQEFSGGQRQRIGIARALALKPKLVVLDEPVSALDVSVQAQIVNLLADIQDELGLAYLFVAHDLSVVRHVSDRIAVMYLGKLVEVAPADALCERPVHPYSEALLAAVPARDPATARRRERIVVPGEPPDPAAPPPGCVFHTRCPRATELCSRSEPPLLSYPDGRSAACHHPLNVAAADIAEASVSPFSPRSAGPPDPPGA